MVVLPILNSDLPPKLNWVACSFSIAWSTITIFFRSRLLVFTPPKVNLSSNLPSRYDDSIILIDISPLVWVIISQSNIGVFNEVEMSWWVVTNIAKVLDILKYGGQCSIEIILLSKSINPNGFNMTVVSLEWPILSVINFDGLSKEKEDNTGKKIFHDNKEYTL